MRHAFTISLMALFAIWLTGCAHYYAAPGRAANMSELGLTAAATDGVPKIDDASKPDFGIDETMRKKPLATFPTAVAVARVQAPGYRSNTACGYGSGKYSVVTTRDVESPQTMERLTKLSDIKGIAPVNRLLLPESLQSDKELRYVAGKLQADMLLIYTIDTTFNDQDTSTPLTLVTLGITPTKRTRVNSTASAVLLDTRNGYVYGIAEASADREAMRNAWSTADEADRTRREVESDAFNKLVGELEKTWQGVVTRYATASAM